MNKRIETLLGRALDSAVPETWTTLTPEQLAKVSEKFAELIVRECVEVCNGEATYDPQTLPYKPSKQFADAIKEHFGVKE